MSFHDELQRLSGDVEDDATPVDLHRLFNGDFQDITRADIKADIHFIKGEGEYRPTIIPRPIEIVENK